LNHGQTIFLFFPTPRLTAAGTRSLVQTVAQFLTRLFRFRFELFQNFQMLRGNIGWSPKCQCGCLNGQVSDLPPPRQSDAQLIFHFGEGVERLFQIQPQVRQTF
jgi:hypothetical protein